MPRRLVGTAAAGKGDGTGTAAEMLVQANAELAQVALLLQPGLRVLWEDEKTKQSERQQRVSRGGDLNALEGRKGGSRLSPPPRNPARARPPGHPPASVIVMLMPSRGMLRGGEGLGGGGEGAWLHISPVIWAAGTGLFIQLSCSSAFRGGGTAQRQHALLGGGGVGGRT